MSPRPEPPPQHVCAAFGARGVQPELIDGGPAWVCGDVVLKPVTNPAEAAWIAQTLDTMRLPDLRLARPLRSTDGRWVVAGWSATRYLEGRPEPRHDEVVAVSLRLHAATAGLPRPRFVDARRDVFSLADRMAWGEEDHPLAMDRGGRLFEMLAALRRPLGLDPQVVHGDLFGNVLFHGDGPPAVIDFTPYWRPAEWAAAVVVVDSLAWGGADPGLVERWAHLADWPQVLLRALLFRLAVNALHPRATPESLEGLQRTYHVVHPLL
ncbi:TIGR02569 family protein [Streptoalloteichus tenebrarius]|uniref:TIGR02569 family protein n=1 Tax=Streptoalloteichus tenebrarius (strain ATCC 17920 / DSM 40477 / JCM 4838 / CBS 697.72 / NBRC 16177 / NCIMB 11028 / NRRL B-12390 / A12253. 1 / ISP 5477) TaxID=1933 RepID=A0ABT1HVW7_STRSD|nr:TIGR02569 family protein [Streptoalloteichus tenebrarius]MCP2259612.1 TIGR02569 family protein [Streptoalloteichus tenebrarius]